MKKQDKLTTPRIISRSEISCWNGWSVGSYAHAWLSDPGHESASRKRPWRKCQVLIVKIMRDEQGNAKYFVARLLDRSAAIRSVDVLETQTRWRAFASLLRWPRRCEFVLYDQVEVVDGRELSTWRRKYPPSLSTDWTIGKHTGRLKKCYNLAGDEVDAPLEATASFRSFMQLPRELRDQIYDFALFDEHQMSMGSRIYVSAAPTKQVPVANRSSGSGPLTLLTLRALPMFQAPGIMRVSKQVRCEALELIYRTKLLVIIVDSASASSTLPQKWPPWMTRFACIRFDVVLSQATAEVLCESSQHMSAVLSLFARDLKSLEIRIRSPPSPVVETIIEPGDTLLRRAGDVVKGLHQLRRAVKVLTKRTASGQVHMAHMRWGVTEKDKDLGDYICNCRYLTPDFLDTVWNAVATESGEHVSQSLNVQEEDCRDFGCCLHGK